MSNKNSLQEMREKILENMKDTKNGRDEFMQTRLIQLPSLELKINSLL